MALTEVLQIRAQQCLLYVQQTVGAAAAALSTIPSNAESALLHNETQIIRLRLDGTNPTAAVGLLVIVSDYIFLEGAELINKARVIRQGAVDSLLSIHYFG